ncbi:ferredoxin [Desulfovibrio sp. UCD-KL4C]|uniref:ferredoxin n=1 Tax=Desulfovibrio sp. UCD-KL4C TaxID=2578120 RepID=UPI0025C254D9|nr:ferredoxin [Desulfovibrio sp. UCD-KL4C]
MAKKVVIDHDECIGCETCVELCPEVFALDAEGEKAEVIKEDAIDLDCVQDSIDSCPVECISIE